MKSLPIRPATLQPPPDGPVRFPACVWDLYPSPSPVAVESFADELLAAVGPMPLDVPLPPPVVAVDGFAEALLDLLTRNGHADLSGKAVAR